MGSRSWTVIWSLFTGLLVVWSQALLAEPLTEEFETTWKSWKAGSKSSSRVKRSPDRDSGLFENLERDTFRDSFSSVSGGLKAGSDGTLPLPPDYNKLVIPTGNISDEIFVFFHLSIREILDVDTRNEILELDTEIGITWIDWKIWNYLINNPERLRALQDQGQDEITLDAEFLKKIWKPDIYIDEMASVERTSILSKLITLNFLLDKTLPGAISFSARQTLKLRCDMNFEYYPADTQICEYTIRSYSYPEEKLFLLWKHKQSVYLDTIKDSNYDFQVTNVEPGEELRDLYVITQHPCCAAQNFSALTFTLKLRRNVAYHIVQTFLPSVLLILITWLCFLLPPTLVDVRIGISMTTVLTLTAMFAAVREQSPEVSYTMAIDVWMVFCIFLVFIALVLFTVIYWIRRRLERVEEKEKEHNIDEIVAEEEKVTYSTILTHSKKYAFWLFAIIFLVFLVTYSVWLFNSSDYLNWDPSPKFNAEIEMEDGSESHKLFDLLEKPFNPNKTRRNAYYKIRFSRLFRRVIDPKLKEIYESEQALLQEKRLATSTTRRSASGRKFSTRNKISSTTTGSTVENPSSKEPEPDTTPTPMQNDSREVETTTVSPN